MRLKSLWIIYAIVILLSYLPDSHASELLFSWSTDRGGERPNPNAEYTDSFNVNFGIGSEFFEIDQHLVKLELNRDDVGKTFNFQSGGLFEGFASRITDGINEYLLYDLSIGIVTHHDDVDISGIIEHGLTGTMEIDIFTDQDAKNYDINLVTIKIDTLTFNNDEYKFGFTMSFYGDPASSDESDVNIASDEISDTNSETPPTNIKSNDYDYGGNGSGCFVSSIF